VLTPAQREKEKAIHDQMWQMHRVRMFSSQGMDAADLEQTADWDGSGIGEYSHVMLRKVCRPVKLGLA